MAPVWSMMAVIDSLTVVTTDVDADVQGPFSCWTIACYIHCQELIRTTGFQQCSLLTAVLQL